MKSVDAKIELIEYEGRGVDAKMDLIEIEVIFSFLSHFQKHQFNFNLFRVKNNLKKISLENLKQEGTKFFKNLQSTIQQNYQFGFVPYSFTKSAFVKEFKNPAIYLLVSLLCYVQCLLDLVHRSSRPQRLGVSMVRRNWKFDYRYHFYLSR
jgi:hypothetical protein